jgi:hypothetical protein
MSAIRRFFAFWYDFVVGDDWTVAAGVVIAFALSALLARSGVDAWWLMPLAVAALLALSLWRATRKARR